MDFDSLAKLAPEQYCYLTTQGRKSGDAHTVELWFAISPETGTLYEATSFISVLSIPLLIDELVPKLAAAADGDPETTA